MSATTTGSSASTSSASLPAYSGYNSSPSSPTTSAPVPALPAPVPSTATSSHALAPRHQEPAALHQTGQSHALTSGTSSTSGTSTYGSSTSTGSYSTPQPAPVHTPIHGASTSPHGTPAGSTGSTTQPGGTTTLADAVQAAHKEGHDFGESVAKDAPALWLEAVLARKPRMPSDLEARLLQGSTLPIDFLLHDEVRHALRRGFWDALERARR